MSDARWPESSAGPARRRRLNGRDRFLAWGGGVFLVVSVLMVVTGAGGDRLAGVACLAFSLAVLAVPVSAMLPEATRAAPALETLDGRPAVVIQGLPGKRGLMAAALVLFAAFGLLLALFPDRLGDGGGLAPRILGIACFLVFGFNAVLSLVTARRSWRLALLPDGLRWELGTGPVLVPWDAIDAVGSTRVSGAAFLVIDVADRSAVATPRLYRLLNRGSGADFSVGLEAFPVDPDRLADAVAAYAEEPELRRELGTPAAVERVA